VQRRRLRASSPDARLAGAARAADGGRVSARALAPRRTTALRRAASE
jgi:hypothetical protein